MRTLRLVSIVALAGLVSGGSIHPARAVTGQPAAAASAEFGKPGGRAAASGRFPIRAIAFSPDGRFLAGGDSHGTLWIWDSATGGAVAHWNAARMDVGSLAFSPNGRTIAVQLYSERSGRESGRVQLWNMHTHRLISTLPAAGYDAPVAFSPDGRLLAVPSEMSYAVSRRYCNPGPHRGAGIRLWNVRAGRWAGSLYAADNSYYEATRDFAAPSAIASMDWSPDGKTLAGIGEWDGDGVAYFVQMWDAATGRRRPVPLEDSDDSGESVVAFSRKGHLLGTVDYTDLRVYDAQHRHLWRTFSDTVSQDMFWGALAFSPDGRYVAAGAEYGRKIVIWNVSTGSVALQIATDAGVERVGPESGGIARLAWSPDGTTLASCGDHGRVDLWRLSPR